MHGPLQRPLRNLPALSYGDLERFRQSPLPGCRDRRGKQLHITTVHTTKRLFLGFYQFIFTTCITYYLLDCHLEHYYWRAVYRGQIAYCLSVATCERCQGHGRKDLERRASHTSNSLFSRKFCWDLRSRRMIGLPRLCRGFWDVITYILSYVAWIILSIMRVRRATWLSKLIQCFWFAAANAVNDSDGQSN
jgi:hypothetical protein